jgi:hypothetical protein
VAGFSILEQCQGGTVGARQEHLRSWPGSDGVTVTSSGMHQFALRVSSSGIYVLNSC